MAHLHGEARSADDKQPIDFLSTAAASSGADTPAGPSHRDEDEEQEEYDVETVEKVYRYALQRCHRHSNAQTMLTSP